MSILDRLRNRSPREADHPGEHETVAADADLPVPGYDRMKADEVVTVLRDLTQVQLAAVETYERTHQDRRPVLDKLRYMRSPEPVEGYDGLDSEQIAEVLASADGQRVKAIRDYERKFRHRRQVLDEAARVLPDARESRANADARAEKEERVRSGMRRAPGKNP